ncbi:MAG: hypothetical protein GX763_07225 [Clostridiaceae bacterium]|nr:hypothetical protein [Clostridiaceae bacterium]
MNSNYQASTCPSEMISFGLGDRLGNAGAAHLKLLEAYNVFPVLAQQSTRELSLTQRTYADVVNAASKQSEELAWERGFGADGDHLKTAKDICIALEAGCKMITLDCSDEFPKIEQNSTEYWDSLSSDKKALYQSLYEEYIVFSNRHDSSCEPLEKAEFYDTVAYFEPVFLFIKRIYEETILPEASKVDFEISIDETSFETPPFAHWLLGGVLRADQIEIFSVAPRFTGAFEKGIDYIGDRDAFRVSLRFHEAIAKHYGHRLSIHSGSDKYSIFPIIAEEIKRPYHLKTAGTHWLVAVELIAESKPELFRDMYRLAEQSFSDAKKRYSIYTEAKDIADVSDFSEEEYPALLQHPNYRQFFHITYGALLKDHDIHDALYKEMDVNKDRYHELLNINLKKHLDKLNLG